SRLGEAKRFMASGTPQPSESICPAPHSGLQSTHSLAHGTLPFRGQAMSLPGSVTDWIDRLKIGDPAAAQQLWQSYFQRLHRIARKKLQGTPRRVADEEDVALSAFDSFCRGAEQGRFPQLTDRDDLWRLLVTITARKAYQLALHEGRQK